MPKPKQEKTKVEEPRELPPPSKGVPAQETDELLIDMLGDLMGDLAKVASALNPEKTPIRVLSPKGHVLLITSVYLNLEVPAICLKTKRP